MGNSQLIKKVNFEYIQSELNNNDSFIISTLPIEKQECLITGTLTPSREIEILNHYLKKNSNIKLIVYAENSSDESLSTKCHQLLKLGYTNILVYPGGLFEWLLLQDIYGDELFPTTSACRDHLKYKGRKNADLMMMR
uniref:Rhodanese domain-containing protein n=1 Tax=viral metagenome TaxID=1070528 RepID=A0A6C0BXZ3_9ZZZZ